MKENLEQIVDETIQSRAAAPGAPGGVTSTNFQIHPDTSTSTFPGGAEAFFSRPGVCYNSGGASNIGQYANFTDGNSGFLIYSENASPILNLVARKKSKTDTSWGPRYILYHSGNLNTSLFATVDSLNAKADKTYVDSKLVTKADKTELATKADKTELTTKADKTYVDNKVAEVSSSIVCSGFANNGYLNCSNGSGTCSDWGNGTYSVMLDRIISGVTITPMTSNSANIAVSVYNVSPQSFSVSITKEGKGYQCPFYFQAFKY